MPKAKLVLHTRYVDEQGGLVEMNHEHKGDHRHFRTTTAAYAFMTIDRLIEDFRRDVGAIKKETGR